MSGRIHGGGGVGGAAVPGRQRPELHFGPGRGTRGARKVAAVRFAPGWDRGGMTTLDANLRRAVLAYLKRSGLSGLQFGQLALGNPEFVLGLDRGRSLTLETADRALRFMGQTPIGPTFRREVEAFLGVTGTGQANLGLRAVEDAAFVEKLRQGASIRLTAVQRVRTWMRATAERSATRRHCAGIGEERRGGTRPRPGSGRARCADRERGIAVRPRSAIFPGGPAGLPHLAPGGDAPLAFPKNAGPLPGCRQRTAVPPVRIADCLCARRPRRMGRTEAPGTASQDRLIGKPLQSDAIGHRCR